MSASARRPSSGEQDRIGDAIKRERAANVVRVRLAAAVAHKGVSPHAAIERGPASERPSAPAMAASG